MRRAWLTLTVVSLACCLLLCGLWGRSWWTCDVIEHGRPGTYVHAAIGRGRVLIRVIQGDRDFGDHVGWWRHTLFPSDSIVRPLQVFRGTGSEVAGFGVSDSGGGGFGSRDTAVWFPLWPPAVFAAIPPALWWRSRMRRRARGFPVEATPNA